jgi:hypothetical protein
MCRRVTLGGLQLETSLGKKVQETISKPIADKKLGMVVHVCYPRDRSKHKIGLWTRLAWAKGENLSLK